MAKLYFKYGVMGSSKSAQALITKFNYEEQGMGVWLIKPAKDTSYGLELVRSRIGLEEKGDAFGQEVDLFLWQKGYSKCQTRSRGKCDYPRGTGLFGRA